MSDLDIFIGRVGREKGVFCLVVISFDGHHYVYLMTTIEYPIDLDHASPVKPKRPVAEDQLRWGGQDPWDIPYSKCEDDWPSWLGSWRCSSHPTLASLLLLAESLHASWDISLSFLECCFEPLKMLQLLLRHLPLRVAYDGENERVVVIEEALLLALVAEHLGLLGQEGLHLGP